MSQSLHRWHTQDNIHKVVREFDDIMSDKQNYWEKYMTAVFLFFTSYTLLKDVLINPIGFVPLLETVAGSFALTVIFIYVANRPVK